jgi:hypothetical protein
VDLVGDGGDQATQEVARRAARRLLMQFNEGELRRSVDSDDEVEFAFCGSDFSDVDMKIADRVSLEFTLGEASPSTRGSREIPCREATSASNAGWSAAGVEAVVERQQGVPSERHDHGFFLNRQDRRPPRPRISPQAAEMAS